MRPFRSRIAALQWLIKRARGKSATVLVRDAASNTLTAATFVSFEMKGVVYWFSGVHDKKMEVAKKRKGIRTKLGEESRGQG